MPVKFTCRLIILPALALLASLALPIAPMSAQQLKHPHLPPPGSSVVIYTHKFAPQNFEQGIDLVSQGFAAAIKALDQDRTSFIMVHPSTFEVLNVSFFENAEEVQRWHAFEDRLEVVDQLKQLMIAPIEIQVYEMHDVHEVQPGSD